MLAMIGADLLRRFAPYLIGAAVLAGAVLYVQALRRSLDQSQRLAAAEQLRADTVTASRDALHALYQRATEAAKAHQATLATLRRRHADAAKTLASIPTDQCLDLALPAAAVGLLKPAGAEHPGAHPAADAAAVAGPAGD